MGQQREVRQNARDYEQIHGVKYDENVQVQPLPKPGEAVVVFENHQLRRTVKDKRGRRITSVYLPSSSYRDAFGDPATYTVVGYSKGIEYPLDDDNWVELFCSYKKGGGFSTRIKAKLVAIGYYKLDKVNNDIHEKLKRKVYISGYIEDTEGQNKA